MFVEIVHGVLHVLVEVFIGCIFYWIGRIAVAALTLGKVTCESYDSDGCGGHFGRDADGFYLSASATSFVGFLTTVVAGVCAWKYF